ncbi:MAG TPA: DNA polymerase III subunit delta [Rhizomicrobium sp.]|jgi:DNA polymerase-3 subunit delta|nr:DNA polymerase III subunit delta [Rhizomicrobium sp.]
MLIKPAEAERFLARLPPDLVAVLFYGPDQGLVRERAEKVITSIVPDLRDPFRIAEIEGAALAEDPGRLYGEAAALSMTGGRRVVRIRAATNALGRILAPFLADRKSEALVVVEAGDLAKDSSLREAFEESPCAASIACYLDSPDTIAELVRSSLKAQGAAIAPDALEEAVSLLGADRGTTRREVEKLLLYMHGRKSVTLEDVRAIMGDEAEARIEEACDAAGEGDAPRLDRTLERLWTAGVSPVGLVRVALGHFQRLALAKAQVAKGESADIIIKRARPPVHFTRVPGFKMQLRNWSEARLGEALDLLLETEALCKTTALPAEAACGRALITIAAWARLPQ